MLYRHKVAIFASVVASITSLVVYVTGPKWMTDPTLRVLLISHSDHAAVKSGLTSSPIVPNEIVHELEISDDGSVSINREDLDLKSTSEEFYQNNLVLECTALFPVSWKYSGFGAPSISEENVRIHGDYNDKSTFSYVSILNLMPLSEKSTGKYTCFGTSNDTFSLHSSVHLFVPGPITLLIDYDTTIDVRGENNILVPCPVSNISANVSLYFKNQPVTSDNIENLLTFDPKSGFYLKPRFLEEQTDPWGQFYCKVEETKEKSGTITLQPTKGLIVKAIPESSTLFLSTQTTSKIKGNGAFEENLKFTCKAKEEITLKFLQVVNFPSVTYEYDASSTFPYTAFVEVSSPSFRNSSRIYCRTTRTNEDLHSWRILLSSLPMRSELMEFSYDEGREEFACCNPSNKRFRMVLVPCNSVTECRIKGYCLAPGRKCNDDQITQLPVKSGCARYKLTKANEKGSASSSKGTGSKLNLLNEGITTPPNENDITVESGLLQCTLEGKTVERMYFSSRRETENGTVQNTISALLKDFLEVEVESSPAENILQPPYQNTQFQFMEVREIQSADITKRQFVCRGARFFVAVGFFWQTVYDDEEIEIHSGRESIKESWIYSKIQLSEGPSPLRRIYCVAPLWESNAESDWNYVKLEF